MLVESKSVAVAGLIGSGFATLLTPDDVSSWTNVLKAIGPFGLMCLFSWYLLKVTQRQQAEISAERVKQEESSRKHHEARDADERVTRELMARALTSIEAHAEQSRHLAVLIDETRRVVSDFGARSEQQAKICQATIQAAITVAAKGRHQ